jgi:phytoene synthase
MSRDAIATASRQSMAAGSKSFAAASRLFDPRTRASAQMFYAWCRHCDDVIDGQVMGRGRIEQAASAAERLARLEGQTRAALAGEPIEEAAFAALQRVIREHAIPEHLPFDILQGFRMDVEERRYGTVEDLLSYCYHVAGAVGVTMALIMGVDPKDGETLDRACDLGLAFQLTNIARDVMEDARNGRVYLPAALLGLAEASPAVVLDPAHHTRVLRATHQLLDLADVYYVSSRAGIARLPFRSAWAIATARRVYREIGLRVRRASDPWAQRQSVPLGRKIMHAASGWVAPIAFAAMRHQPRAGLWTRP